MLRSLSHEIGSWHYVRLDLPMKMHESLTKHASTEGVSTWEGHGVFLEDTQQAMKDSIVPDFCKRKSDTRCSGFTLSTDSHVYQVVLMT